MWVPGPKRLALMLHGFAGCCRTEEKPCVVPAGLAGTPSVCGGLHPVGIDKLANAVFKPFRAVRCSLGTPPWDVGHYGVIAQHRRGVDTELLRRNRKPRGVAPRQVALGNVSGGAENLER
jgi:hypothetical protein